MAKQCVIYPPAMTYANVYEDLTNRLDNRQIQAKYQVSLHAVLKFYKIHNLQEYRQQNYSRDSKRLYTSVHEMWLAGHTDEEIAKVNKVSAGHVYKTRCKFRWITQGPTIRRITTNVEAQPKESNEKWLKRIREQEKKMQQESFNASSIYALQYM